MRCDDLTRELASPTGAIAQADLAGHLAACPACAEWSRRAARFDRIWEATRPVEPSADVLDALWARASVELESRKVPSTLEFAQSPRRRRWALAGFAMAQAAVVFIAAVVLLRGDSGKPIEVAGGPPPRVEPVREPELFDFEAKPDVLPIVRIDKANVGTLEEVDLSPPLDSSSIPPGTQKDLMDGGETMAPTVGSLASK